MSRRSGAGANVQPPSATNPRGIQATGDRRAKTKGTAVITLDDLDRIREQVVKTKADGYEAQRDTMRKNL